VAQQRIAIVGAGLAGLAAALDLKDAGAKVELFERSRLLGGRATSFDVDGREVDNGQHVFLACCTEFIAFAQRIGMGEHLHLQPRFDALVLARDGTVGRLRAGSLPAPLHLAVSFLRYPHLRLDGKLRIARALLRALRSRGGNAAASFEGWLDETGQNAQTRRAFWDPFFIPALNAPFDRVANADAMFVLTTAFLRDAKAARFGFSTIPLAHFAAAAATRLDAVRLSAAVVRAEPADGGVRLQLLDGSTEAFDAVVLAVPPRTLAKLLEDSSGCGVTGLENFDAFPILDVHLWHDAGSIGFDFAAALESPLQWIFEKSPGYVCCSFSAADDYLRLPTAELEALAWSEARAFLPALRQAKLVAAAVTRNPDATYLPRIGTRRPSQRTACAAIAIAGAWTETGWPDTMESAIRSGRAAASVILSGASEGRAVEGTR
jgi:squalene-associated FAD-dependent desaturase